MNPGQLPARHTSTALSRFRGLASRPQLQAAGVTPAQLTEQLRVRHWRRIGPSIILHYGPLTSDQLYRASLAGHGRGAVLASFTALQRHGLLGWERDELHVLAKIGTGAFQHPELPKLVLHTATSIPRSGPSVELAAAAAIRAASSCLSERVACGLVASVVGQGVASVGVLRQHLVATATHHRAALSAAISDMAQDEDSLTDLDIESMCRMQRLPEPALTQIRRDSSGRRRFLESVWQLPANRSLVVEIDAAIQLAGRRWWEPRLKPSHLAFSANGVLRIPSTVVRHEPQLLQQILRRELSAARAAS